ncbi:hypothetical protein E2C01_067673 [Portunus trituberculatus]|uniref:Uncharacterized protein n=1 Tax=Portunus trituberculatus TaxID=210409 RepID=A0A5B7HXC9_PORTR|nr:hypothetical protein [Portunus trituberculatus]
MVKLLILALRWKLLETWRQPGSSSPRKRNLVLTFTLSRTMNKTSKR